MSSEFDLIVSGGTIVSSSGRKRADIGVIDGKIQAVGDLAGHEATERIDATGLHILPGVIDTQVHFREPGLTHKEDIAHGSLAAVMGGVTTFFEMPNTNPTTTDAAALKEKLEIAAKTSWANYAFFIGATNDNTEELEALEQLPGTPGVKVFVGSSTGNLLVEKDEMIRQVFLHGKRPCPIHSEDEERLRERKKLLEEEPHVREHPFVRDAEAARISTERVLALCKETKRPVHILHISTLDEIPMLRNAKWEGLPVTCEVTPQHLTFNADDYETLGTKVQMNPPVRAEEHRMALWEAVKEGLFNVFGSDHAPHTLEEKQQPFPKSPSGMPGVQTMLPILLDWSSKGEIELEQIVAMTSENPADLYGIKNKGLIEKGYDADLAIVNLEESFEVKLDWLQSKCGWSPFEARVLTGKPIATVVSGTVCVRDSKFVGKPAGKMVEFTWKS